MPSKKVGLSKPKSTASKSAKSGGFSTQSQSLEQDTQENVEDIESLTYPSGAVIQQAQQNPQGLAHNEILQLQPVLGNRAITRMLTGESSQAGRQIQRLKLTLPHPKRSKRETWDVDTTNREQQGYLINWIEQAAKTNKPALLKLIERLNQIEAKSHFESIALSRAIEFLSKPDEPLVKQDSMRDNVANVTEGLIDAYRVDYTAAKTYMEEGEGQKLAAHWGVDAEVFDQPQSKEKIIRSVTRYGEGQPKKGYLLFVGGNHYITLTPTGGEADFITPDGRKFKRGDEKTRSDGNCLIDGLFIIKGTKRITLKNLEEASQEARNFLAQNMSDSDIKIQLQAAITSMMEGEFVQGLGPYTQQILDNDTQLQQLSLQARLKKQSKSSVPSFKSKFSSYKYQPSKSGSFNSKEESVIGLPGVNYQGPTRKLDPGTPTVNHGLPEMEYAEIEKQQVPCVRLYMTVVSAQNMEKVDPGTGFGESNYKDVQQTTTGKIIISQKGEDTAFYINAGQPLRALKWAHKYLAEHRETAENKLKEAQQKRTELELLQKQRQELVSKSGDKLEIEKLVQQEKLLEGQIAAAENTASTLQNPLIRSFLIPYDAYEKLVSTALPQEQVKGQDVIENSDQYGAPGQYGFKGSGLKNLRDSIVPNSLITYSNKPQVIESEDEQRALNVKSGGVSTNGGQLVHMDELKLRLGVPLVDDTEGVWTQGKEHQKHERAGGVATKLVQHYATWLQSLEKSENPEPNAFLTGKIAKIPYKSRKTALDKFLTEKGIEGAENIQKYMETVVAPWATQALITKIEGDEYTKTKMDENVGSSGGLVNDFYAMKQKLPQERQQQVEVGGKIDEMLHSGEEPAEIIEMLMDEFPELGAMFSKVSNKQQYYFYEHAQIVINQLLKVSAGSSEKRLLSIPAMVKMILFHDMEKWNSRTQYKDEVGEKASEHVLSVAKMRKYRHLWGEGEKNQQEAYAVSQIVDSDPFGEYLKNKITRDETFMEIIGVARRAGISMKDYPQFFKEFHQFYQSDFSAYTSTSSYRSLTGKLPGQTFDDENKPYAKAGEETQSQNIGNIDSKFNIQGKDENREITHDPKEGRFIYDKTGEEKFKALQAMFKDEETIILHLTKLDPELLKSKGGDKEKGKKKKEVVQDIDDGFVSPNFFEQFSK